MPNWMVSGASIETGEDKLMYVDSPSKEDAEALAVAAGMLVSSSTLNEPKKLSDREIAGYLRLLAKTLIVLGAIFFVLGGIMLIAEISTTSHILLPCSVLSSGFSLFLLGAHFFGQSAIVSVLCERP
jgi:VIT1/CCC1 family predicted Fe2+/Mn2+ transporter